EDAQHLADVPWPGVLELGRDHRGPSSVAALTGGDTADAAERAHTTRLPQGIRGDRRRASLVAISRPAGPGSTGSPAASEHRRADLALQRGCSRPAVECRPGLRPLGA